VTNENGVKYKGLWEETGILISDKEPRTYNVKYYGPV
jgi:hypothetical protein